MQYVVLSSSVMCDSLQLHGMQPTSVLGDSPGKNNAVGFHDLLQGILPAQGSNPGLPHCRKILYHLRHQGSPTYNEIVLNLKNGNTTM